MPNKPSKEIQKDFGYNAGHMLSGLSNRAPWRKGSDSPVPTRRKPDSGYTPQRTGSRGSGGQYDNHGYGSDISEANNNIDLREAQKYYNLAAEDKEFAERLGSAGEIAQKYGKIDGIDTNAEINLIDKFRGDYGMKEQGIKKYSSYNDFYSTSQGLASTYEGYMDEKNASNQPEASPESESDGGGTSIGEAAENGNLSSGFIDAVTRTNQFWRDRTDGSNTERVYGRNPVADQKGDDTRYNQGRAFDWLEKYKLDLLEKEKQQ